MWWKINILSTSFTKLSNKLKQFVGKLVRNDKINIVKTISQVITKLAWCMILWNIKMNISNFCSKISKGSKLCFQHNTQGSIVSKNYSSPFSKPILQFKTSAISPTSSISTIPTPISIYIHHSNRIFHSPSISPIPKSAHLVVGRGAPTNPL